MPTNRQRRPRVAGLRKPGEKPSPRPRPSPAPRDEPAEVADAGQATEVAEPEAPAAAEPTEPTEDTATTEDSQDGEAPVAKPAPRTKLRDEGARKPDQEVEPEPAEDGEAAEAGAEPAKERVASGRHRERRLFVGALAIGVVFALVAGILGFFYVRTGDSTENAAFSDPVATAGLKEQMQQSVHDLLSYHFEDLDTYERRIDEIVTEGPLRAEFEDALAEARAGAADQERIVDTEVAYVAPMDLRGDTASVLAFIVQRVSRNGTMCGVDAEAPPCELGMLTLETQLVNDRWRIAELTIHGTPVDPAIDEDDSADDEDDN